MKRRIRRGAALILAAVTFSTSMTASVHAAAPRVMVDETMYVNLDYYGTATKINVVKGCTPNGVKEYTDYGSYEKVVNMTDRTEPVLEDGAVRWELPETGKRFYYQCTMPEGSVTLPWDFDISYKLNGREMDASKLAGASGLVEIRIQATPNRKAGAYYRNNMMLTAVVPVDMERCYSVEAPGSQLQSIGSNTVAMFAALPGEEGDFTVRIGTDDYESVGVIMMMVPGTADALNHIKDLKEAKDTWREDGDNMYDSMNQLLRAMESMRGEVSQVQGGLDSLEQARGKINANRKQIESLSTQALSEMQATTDQMAALIPYLKTARDAVTDINSNTNAIYNTMEDMQDELDRLYDRLGSLSKTLASASNQISQGITPEQQQALGQLIGKETAEIQKILDALGALAGGGFTMLEEVEEENDSLGESLTILDQTQIDRNPQPEGGQTLESADGGTENRLETSETAEKETSDSAEKETTQSEGKPEKETAQSEEKPEKETAQSEEKSEKETAQSEEKSEKETAQAEETQPEASGASEHAKGDSEPVTVMSFGKAVSGDAVVTAEGEKVGPSGQPGSGGVNDAVFEEEFDGAEDEVEESLQTLLGTSYSSDIQAMVETSRGILEDSQALQQTIGTVIGKINAACQGIGTVGTKTASTLSALRSSADELINLLDDSRVLIDTMDSYVPSMLDALTDSEELMNRLTRSLYAVHDMLKLVNDTLISAGDSLDAGTRDSLQGLSGLLEKSLSVIDSITSIREASEEMKRTLDEQLDKYEEENQFLNMDPEADKISFTSTKNPSPNSLQIILRTDEISDEDETTDISDLEADRTGDEGPFQRMWNVIVEIFRAIVDIFRNR